MKERDSDRPPLTHTEVEVILQIARHRVRLLYELKQAILDGDSAREHAIAREVCGLPKEAARV